MRINKFVALASGLSRRAADLALQEGRVVVDGQPATPATVLSDTSQVILDGQPLHVPTVLTTVQLHKPAGYVVSRDGQGSRTIYDLLPPELHNLKPIGRLDKDSSGLLLLTNDGALAQQLTHPSNHKIKQYEIQLDQPLQPLHRQMISDFGVQLDDGPSKLQLERIHEADDTAWKILMREGRNRQIRRTFGSLGYTVIQLHRTTFGTFTLGNLRPGHYQRVTQ